MISFSPAYCGCSLIRRRRCQAIDAGHHVIDDGHVIGPAVAVRFGKASHRGLRVRCAVDLRAEALKLQADDPPVQSIVVDDEATPARQIGVQAVADLHAGRHGVGKADMEREGAALIGLALDVDLAVHQLDQLLADGQAKPGAVIFPPGRTVDLGEMIEYARQMVGRYADAGIGDAEIHLMRAVRPRAPPARTSMAMPPRSVNLIALLASFSRIWRSRPASPDSFSGRDGST